MGRWSARWTGAGATGARRLRGLGSALAAGTIVIASAAGAVDRPPSAGGIGPADAPGNPRVFTTTFRDPDGWSDLATVRFTIRDAADPANRLDVRYRPATNRLAVRDGARWRGACRPGQPTAPAVPTGRLYCRHTRVRRAGTRLTVRWFLGVRSGLEDRELELRLAAVDRTGRSSGWVAAGTWRATAPQPLPFGLFPPGSPWNTDVSAYPVHPDSASFIASIGLERGLHADFGAAWRGSPVGIPFVQVRDGQPPVPVAFTWPDESDPGPYPVPASPPIEGGPAAGGDRHVLVVDVDNLLLYELYGAHRAGDGWTAGSGAVFDLTADTLRPDGWTSADAAGLPILPGLVRYEEVAAGAVNHALRFTVARTQRGYIHPATHFASASTDPALPPMGLRVRLRGDFDTSGFPATVRTILEALKTYGMFVADNGSDWFLSGVPSENWDPDELGRLGEVTGADFEAVATGPIRR